MAEATGSFCCAMAAGAMVMVVRVMAASRTLANLALERIDMDYSTRLTMAL
jgi:hypothetical protein